MAQLKDSSIQSILHFPFSSIQTLRQDPTMLNSFLINSWHELTVIRRPSPMPKRTDIHKILVIGSGPIIIGQAAEFDYSGTQACLALREEGYETILVNSNPATIMTDKEIADHVYIEPLTVDSLSRIIRQEYP